MIYESLLELLDQSHRIQPQNVNASYQVGGFLFYIIKTGIIRHIPIHMPALFLIASI